MNIYQRIKSLREQRGMSQQELAERVGYKTASAVNKIELGLRDINQTKIVLFAEALGTTPSYLMGWTEEKAPPVSRRGTPGEEMQPISENTQKLVDFVKTVPEDKAEYLLRVMKSILE